MARILWSEGEDLVATFHPHAASFGPRYLKDLIWYVYGLAGAWLAWQFKDIEFLQAGAFVFAALALVHAVVAGLAHRDGIIWSVVWALLGTALGVLELLGNLPIRFGWLYTLGLGATAALLLLLWTDIVRRRRNYHVTDRRFIITEGVKRRTQRSVELARIESVLGQQGIGGQIFGYGTVTLSLPPTSRRKNERAPVEEIHGVPHYEKMKHTIELAVSDARLSPKERAKRVEERRLRESMHAVASWVRRDKA